MKRNAFSLIEITMTVAIIALLTVAAYPSINKLADRENLTTTMSEMRNCYLQARAYAKAPRASSVDSYSANYNAQGCQVIENGASAQTVNSYSFRHNSITFADLTNSESLNIKISTTPPYVMTATNAAGPVAQTVVLIKVTDPTVSAVPGTIFINLQSGVIMGDAQ